MKLAVQLNSFINPEGTAGIADQIAERAVWAEAAGFKTFFMMDHFFQLEGIGPFEDPMLDVFSVLSYVAGKTKTIKLGQMVLGVTYRNPAIAIKQQTTLDVLSGGRSYFGIGAAWFEREHLAVGIPFPTLKERFERLEEQLQIAKQLWGDSNGPFNGQHYQLVETVHSPQPLSRPHPPILIGGSGEKKTLRMVAQYGDACNITTAKGIDVLRQKLAVLQEHCTNLGRDYADIEKTSNGGFGKLSRSGAEGTMHPDEAFAFLEQLAASGIDTALMGILAVDAPDSREIVEQELIPFAESLTVAGR
jgi:F420-dependent oxidoreductase-like protein